MDTNVLRMTGLDGKGRPILWMIFSDLNLEAKKMISSRMTTAQATWTTSMGMERERMVILTSWVVQMSKEEQHISRGSRRHISPSNLAAHLGEVIDDTYVGRLIFSKRETLTRARPQFDRICVDSRPR